MKGKIPRASRRPHARQDLVGGQAHWYNAAENAQRRSAPRPILEPGGSSIYQAQLPIIITPSTNSALADPDTLYTEFELPKRSGGIRAIRAPVSALKSIQRKLLALLETLYSPRVCVDGFVKKQSIRSNAAAHSNKTYVPNVDIEEFFPSIKFGRVRGALIARPFSLSPTWRP